MDMKVKYKPPAYTVGDMVLLRNHTKTGVEPRFKGYFRVVSIKGNQIQVMPINGKESQWAHITDVKYVLPADRIIDHLPTVTETRRPATLNIHPNKEPDLNWKLATSLNTMHTSTNNTVTTVQASLKQNWTVMMLTTTLSLIPI